MSLQLTSDFQDSAVQYQRIGTSIGGMSRFGYHESAESPILDRLAKALVEAGVNPDKLDRRAENEKRLAIVARLFELPVSTDTDHDQTSRKAPSALPKWRLKRVVEYVDANISEQITLAALASTAGMSRMYFASQFKAATGMRPHDYVLNKRIERAQTLLLTTSEPLVEIALSVGFQTQAHFTTIFKKIVGNTPLRWRRGQQS
ncbi:helix-turn-helix domain-containing protein [Hyphomicrobium sp.]|jgi:transcriptional regulator GlxA family with amidase domain|uniref:helix-turn-helix domain-containing protein n=1 Tax=Hyphomicrobium sp. TaxID=82 RepID=UPI003566F848